MVTINLIEKNQSYIKWSYLPEDDHTKKPGIIEINLVTEKIEVIECAEIEIYRIIPACELNDMRNNINQMMLEIGEPELTEKELPRIIKDEKSYFYGDHAINRILKDYNKGIVSNKGIEIWY